MAHLLQFRLWIIINFSVCCSIRVKFNVFSTGTFFEMNPTREGCINVPEEYRNVSGQFYVTTDTCLMTYDVIDCLSSQSRTVTPRLEEYRKVLSFKTCQEDIVDLQQLNIDIIKHVPDKHKSVEKNPFHIMSFRNVCSCQNIPWSTQWLDEYSIINYDKEFYAYYDVDCSDISIAPLLIVQNGTNITEGSEIYWQINPKTSQYQIIQSFGPDRRSVYFKHSCGDQFKKIDVESEKPANSSVKICIGSNWLLVIISWVISFYYK